MFRALRATAIFIMGVANEASTGEMLTAADVDEIRIDVTKQGADEPTYTNTISDPSDVIFDEPVTDDKRWSGPSTGYNFGFMVPPNAIPDVGIYDVEVEITPVSGYEVVGKWTIQTESRPNKV